MALARFRASSSAGTSLVGPYREDAADEAVLLRLVGGEVSAGEGQLTQQRFRPHDLRHCTARANLSEGRQGEQQEEQWQEQEQQQEQQEQHLCLNKNWFGTE